MAVHPSGDTFVYALFPNVKKISDISSKRVYSFLTFAVYPDNSRKAANTSGTFSLALTMRGQRPGQSQTTNKASAILYKNRHRLGRHTLPMPVFCQFVSYNVDSPIYRGLHWRTIWGIIRENNN